MNGNEKNGRRLSQAALAAGEIRAILKKEFPGQKFQVRSENYSGGDSINVNWLDGPLAEKVEALVKKYEYGNFNPMEDLYEYSNVIEGLPQVKFLFCQRRISPAKAKEIASQYVERYGHEIAVADDAWSDGSAKAEWGASVPANWKGYRNADSELYRFEREEMSA